MTKRQRARRYRNRPNRRRGRREVEPCLYSFLGKLLAQLLIGVCIMVGVFLVTLLSCLLFEPLMKFWQRTSSKFTETLSKFWIEKIVTPILEYLMDKWL